MLQLSKLVIDLRIGLNLFVEVRGFLTFRSSPRYSGKLGVIVDIPLQGVNERGIFYLRALFLLKKEIIVFIEQKLLLLEGLPEVDTCILDFEGISAALAKLGTLFLKIGKDVIAIYSIGVYKVIGFLSYGKAFFPIIDFILIGRVPIVISVYFLYQTLLLCVQYIYIPVLLSNIRKFLGQSNDRSRGRRGRVQDRGGKVSSDYSVYYISNSYYSLRIYSNVRDQRRSGLRGFRSVNSSAIRLLLNLIEAGQNFGGVISY